LVNALQTRANPPAVLIGHSWGAWLSILVSGRFPNLVQKLILVGTAAFEERYVTVLRDNRLKPLSPSEREEFLALARILSDPGQQTEAGLKRLAELADRSDTYNALPESRSPVAGVSERAAEIYAGVWPAAARLRTEGKWLPQLEEVACPVVAIHGANEPTPVESVATPLSRAVSDFRMVVLERCGHTPWPASPPANKAEALARSTVVTNSLCGPMSARPVPTRPCVRMTTPSIASQHM
jgi:pimeloyl-ACP methyl ester carboxylesterase